MESLLTDRLSVLSHPARMSIFRLLMRRFPDELSAGDILRALDLKPSTASNYLAALNKAGLIHQRRQATALFYRAALEGAREMVSDLFEDCCRGRPDLCPTSLIAPLPAASGKPGRVLNVLFLCTGNSARSIMAEAIMGKLSNGRFKAYSAGTAPATAPNAEALRLLSGKGYDTSALTSKPLAQFQGADAPHLDFVFTVCDRAANEECAPWPGAPFTGHWGTPDPARAAGTLAEQKLAFQETYGALANRISAFCALPFETLTRSALQQRLDAIASTTGKEQ